MKSRIIAVLLSALVGSAIIAGCGEPAPDSQGGAQNSGGTTASQSGGTAAGQSSGTAASQSGGSQAGGQKENTPDGQPGSPGSQSDSGAGDQAGQDTPEVITADSSRTWWDKQVSYEIIPLPEEAFDNGAEKCRGMASDGKTFLMTDGAAPSLYNIETGERVYLTPADSGTEEVLRMFMSGPGRPGRPGSGDPAGTPDPETLSGRDLVEAYLFKQNMALIGPNCSPTVLPSDEKAMLLYDSNGLFWLVDYDTGEFHVSKDEFTGEGYYASIRNRKILIRPLYPLAAASVIDLDAGTRSVEDFTEAGGFESGAAAMSGAVYLPDGSICAVLVDREINMVTNDDGKSLMGPQNCAVVIRDAAGNDQVYDLPEVLNGREPDTILSVGSNYIILSSRQGGFITPSYLVNRATGEVSVLCTSEKEIITAIPAEDFSFDNGVPVWPEGCEPVLFYETMADGCTILAQDRIGNLILFRPETMEAQYPLGPDAPAPLLNIPYYCSNHYDIFFIPEIGGWTSYVQLNVQD